MGAERREAAGKMKIRGGGDIHPGFLPYRFDTLEGVPPVKAGPLAAAAYAQGAVFGVFNAKARSGTENARTGDPLGMKFKGGIQAGLHDPVKHGRPRL
jgi:hypothetical protein